MSQMMNNFIDIGSLKQDYQYLLDTRDRVRSGEHLTHYEMQEYFNTLFYFHKVLKKENHPLTSKYSPKETVASQPLI